jgi:hypothetical protein
LKELVFVDCDLTLVKTDVYPMLCKQMFFDRRKNKFFYQWKFVATEARPTAHQFLEALGQKYKVHILSLGHSVFQTRVLTELGMIDMVDKIWGPDNVHELSRPENFVLIDDMSGESLGIGYKMTWLGRKRGLMSMDDFNLILDKHFIHCRPYECGPEHDEHLTDFLPTIDNLIEKQQEALKAENNRRRKSDITVRTSAQE